MLFRSRNADIKIFAGFKYIIAWVTPVILILVFVGALISPAGNEWTDAFKSLLNGNGWPLDNSSVIKQITSAEIRQALAMATTLQERSDLQLKLTLVNGAKILLLTVFSGITLLVYAAGKKRQQAGRISTGN